MGSKLSAKTVYTVHITGTTLLPLTQHAEKLVEFNITVEKPVQSDTQTAVERAKTFAIEYYAQQGLTLKINTSQTINSSTLLFSDDK
jgi:hypothetical protein